MQTEIIVRRGFMNFVRDCSTVVQLPEMFSTQLHCLKAALRHYLHVLVSALPLNLIDRQPTASLFVGYASVSNQMPRQARLSIVMFGSLSARSRSFPSILLEAFIRVSYLSGIRSAFSAYGAERQMSSLSRLIVGGRQY